MLQAIRRESRKVVALGSCAINGMPSNHRNFFDAETLEEIRPVLDKFGLFEKIKPIGDVVKVDLEIPGCPIADANFIKVMEDMLREHESNA